MKSYVGSMLVLCAVIFISNPVGAEPVEPQEVELALVDLTEVLNEEVLREDVAAKTAEMEYEHVVHTRDLDLFLQDEIDEIWNIAYEDITGEVEEMIRDAEDMLEVKEKPGIKEITDQIRQEFEDEQ